MLALNDIYLFNQNVKESVTSYLPHSLHHLIMKDLLLEPIVSLSGRSIVWCTQLSQVRLPTWYEVQKTTIPFLQQAIETLDDNPTDLIIANILHKAALLFSNGSPDSGLEDSLMHNFVSNLFENVFSLDPILQSSWANGQLSTKRKYEEDHTQFKPDYVVYVTQRSYRLDLACAEAKSPVGNLTTFPKSDLVKLGQEMRWMINELVQEGVCKPVVGGILVSGFYIKTYKMEIIDTGVYRMVELSNTRLFSSMIELTMVPVIISNLLQLKTIVLKTASTAKDRLRNKSKGVTPEFDPPVSWLRYSEAYLEKRQKTKE